MDIPRRAEEQNNLEATKIKIRGKCKEKQTHAMEEDL